MPQLTDSTSDSTNHQSPIMGTIDKPRPIYFTSGLAPFSKRTQSHGHTRQKRTGWSVRSKSEESLVRFDLSMQSASRYFS